MNELRGNRWIRSLRNITTTLQIREYITLWSLLQDIQLDPVVDDTILWTASSSGSYSASSAYQLQFAGATIPFLATKVWGTKAEPKCKLFMWLLLHRKALTADRLAIRGWPHDEVCKLCLTGYETNEHLARECFFSRGVWGIVTTWLSIPHGAAPIFSTLEEWWNANTEGCDAAARMRFGHATTYVLWNVWKERNRRIFNDASRSVLDVAYLVMEDLNQVRWAFALTS